MIVSQIAHFHTIKDYAIKNSIDWRTAKKRLSDWKVVCFLFRKKKIYIEKQELIRFVLSLK